MIALFLILCIAHVTADLNGFREAMKRGDFASARDFVAHTPPEGQLALKQEYDMLQRKITKELTDLKMALDSSAPMKKLTPAFEWCQSVDSVFMNVKFAHKLDAPATLNVEANNVTITEQRIHLEASNGAKYFHLSIPLNAAIVPEESTYTMASVGRMTFTLKKVEAPSKWPKLVAKHFNAHKELGKSVMHFWHQLHEQYSSELDLLDDEDDDEDDRKRKEKERRRVAQAKAKEEREKEKSERESMEEAVSAAATPAHDGSGDASESAPEAAQADAVDSPTSFEAMSAAAAQANEDAYRAEEEKKAAAKREREERIKEARRQANSRLDQDLAELESSRKRRKKEVDGKAVDEKLSIDKDIAEQKAALESSRATRVKAAEDVARATEEEKNGEL